MYTEQMYNDSLAHHGILGQKWGVLNGPPYPLSYQSHSRTEKKKNSTSRIDGISKYNKPKSADNRLVKESKKSSAVNAQSNKSKAAIKTSSKSTTKSKTQSKSSEKTETKGKKQLTEKQKKILKGVAVGAGVAAVAGLSVYAYHKNPAVKKAVDDFVRGFKNKSVTELDDGVSKTDIATTKVATAKINKAIPPEKDFIIGDKDRKIYQTFADGRKNELAQYDISLIEGAAKDKDFVEDWEGETLFWANKNAFGLYDGRHHNCISVAIASEYRQRGYDVVAKEMFDDDHYNYGDVYKIFGRQNVKNPKLTSYSEIEKYLLDQGDGARGIIGGFYSDKSEGAHFLNYQISDGKITLFDAQQGCINDLDDYFDDVDEENPLLNITKTLFVRTDNLELDNSMATTFVEPNKGGFYDIDEELADKWREFGPPKSQSIEVKRINGQKIEAGLKRSVKKGYKYVQGIHE